MTSHALSAAPTDVVLSRLEAVQQQGRGFRARCPNCGGRSRKVSVSEGDDGRVLLHCFGGCSATEVIQALGLTTADLFPVRLRPETPDERRAWRRAAREAGWGAALDVLDYEATLVLLAARAVAAGEPLSSDDLDRLAQAAGRINEARGVLRGR